MILFWLGTFLMVLAALLRMGLGALAKMDRAAIAQASATGALRAERHHRLLGRDDWQVLAGSRIERLVLLTGAICLAASFSTGDLGGGWVIALTLTITLGTGAVGSALGAVWKGSQRLTALVSLTGRLQAGLWRREVPADAGETLVQEEELAQEKEMISSVLEFSDTIVREVMVPRTDMVTVAVDAGLEDLAGIVTEYGFSRFPVLDGGIDHVVGMVLAKDLIAVLVEGRADATVADIHRTPLYVPETKAVSQLLWEMRRSGDHMAVVIDEHGGTAGLVTIEDLLEELVGEIVDEHDERDEWLRTEGAGTWHVDGRFPVDDLGEILGVPLPQEEWDTVGGLVLALAGRVPRVGEVLSTSGVDFTVIEVLGHRVSELTVQWSGETMGEGMAAAAVG